MLHFLTHSIGLQLVIHNSGLKGMITQFILFKSSIENLWFSIKYCFWMIFHKSGFKCLMNFESPLLLPLYLVIEPLSLNIKCWPS